MYYKNNNNLITGDVFWATRLTDNRPNVDGHEVGSFIFYKYDESGNMLAFYGTTSDKDMPSKNETYMLITLKDGKKIKYHLSKDGDLDYDVLPKENFQSFRFHLNYAQETSFINEVTKVEKHKNKKSEPKIGNVFTYFDKNYIVIKTIPKIICLEFDTDLNIPIYTNKIEFTQGYLIKVIKTIKRERTLEIISNFNKYNNTNLENTIVLLNNNYYYVQSQNEYYLLFKLDIEKGPIVKSVSDKPKVQYKDKAFNKIKTIIYKTDAIYDDLIKQINNLKNNFDIKNHYKENDIITIDKFVYYKINNIYDDSLEVLKVRPKEKVLTTFPQIITLDKHLYYSIIGKRYNNYSMVNKHIYQNKIYKLSSGDIVLLKGRKYYIISCDNNEYILVNPDNFDDIKISKREYLHYLDSLHPSDILKLLRDFKVHLINQKNNCIDKIIINNLFSSEKIRYNYLKKNY